MASDSTAAARQRRRRERQQTGRVALTVDVPQGLEARLYRLGYLLDASEVGHRAPLRRALEDALEDLTEEGELIASHRDPGD